MAITCGESPKAPFEPHATPSKPAEDAIGDNLIILRHDIQNLHLDLVRQFALQKVFFACLIRN